jgi:GTP cyclohydrolase II
MHKVERGLFELRRGRALYVSSSASAVSVLIAAVENLQDQTLEQLRSLGGPLRLVVTYHRGRAMGLAAKNGRVPPHLTLGLTDDVSPSGILRLATASAERLSQHPTEWLDVNPALEAEAAGLALTRLGRLVPAVVSTPVDADHAPRLRELLRDGTILDLTSEHIDAMVSDPGIEVTLVTEAPVPLADAEDARFIFFRETNGFLEHVAILIGERSEWPDPVPVRIHSACLTGDLFGSLRCDCGEQLHGSLRHFADHGGGVLVYLAQEGRGIGLGNKIRAYALQQEGLDTVDADGTLGFGADERQYDAAVAILQHLDIERVQLLTNNPDKVRAVEEGGIQMADRLPLHGTLNHHNLPYVRAKVHRAGHWLTDMLAQGVTGD